MTFYELKAAFARLWEAKTRQEFLAADREVQKGAAGLLRDLIDAVDLLAEMRNLDIANTSLEFQGRREAILKRLGVE